MRQVEQVDCGTLLGFLPSKQAIDRAVCDYGDDKLIITFSHPGTPTTCTGANIILYTD